jgi:hypothetical protein
MKTGIRFILAIIFGLAATVTFSLPLHAALRVIGTADYQGSSCQLVWEEDNNGKSLVWLDYTHEQDNFSPITSWASSLDSRLTIHLTPPYHVTWIDPTWRLPDTSDDGLDSTGCDGSTSAGWNISSSEMGHLFYLSLGCTGYKDTSCNTQMYDHKFEPFRNLTRGEYWSETIGINHQDPPSPWGFNFNAGEQRLIHGTGFALKGLAVRAARVTTGAETCSSEYLYFMPYFASGEGKWTGLGLANDSATETAEICVSVFSPDGTPLSLDSRIIAANGQSAFPVSGNTSPASGWIKIQSSAPLSGLSFIGTGNGDIEIMADIPVVSQLATKLVIPQVACDDTWDTQIFIANPGSEELALKLAYFTPGGETPYNWKSYKISKNGSRSIDVGELLNQNQVLNGKVVINATGDGVAAFALYNDLKSGGHYFAGVNAVIPALSSN